MLREGRRCTRRINEEIVEKDETEEKNEDDGRRKRGQQLKIDRR